VVAVCREMHWDYNQYRNAPMWFITIITDMLQVEGEHQKRLNKKNK